MHNIKKMMTVLDADCDISLRLKEIGALYISQTSATFLRLFIENFGYLLIIVNGLTLNVLDREKINWFVHIFEKIIF